MKKYQQGFEANEIFDWLRHSPNRCSHVSYQLTENLFFSSRSMNCFYLEASPKPPCERKFSLARNKGEVLHSVLKNFSVNSILGTITWVESLHQHMQLALLFENEEKSWNWNSYFDANTLLSSCTNPLFLSENTAAHPSSAISFMLYDYSLMHSYTKCNLFPNESTFSHKELFMMFNHRINFSKEYFYWHFLSQNCFSFDSQFV